MSNFKFLLSDPSFTPFMEVAMAAENALFAPSGHLSQRERQGGCAAKLPPSDRNRRERPVCRFLSPKGLGSPSGRSKGCGASVMENPVYFPISLFLA